MSHISSAGRTQEALVDVELGATRGTPEFHPGLDNFSGTLALHPGPGEASSGDTGDLTVVITVDGDGSKVERVRSGAHIADIQGGGGGGRSGHWALMGG